MNKLRILSVMMMCAVANIVIAQEPPIQSQAIRTMMFTCDLDKTVAFYRDVLGQAVQRETVVPPSMAPFIVDVPPGGKARYAILEGRGDYPAGNIVGSSLSVIELPGPNNPACKPVKNAKGKPGNVVMQMRVANIQEIAKRAKAAGAEIIRAPGPSVNKLTWQMLMYDPNGIVLELSEVNIVPIVESN